MHALLAEILRVPRLSQVEPGEIRVAVGGASDQLPLEGAFLLCGPERVVGPDRVLDTPAEVRPAQYRMPMTPRTSARVAAAISLARSFPSRRTWRT